jgi:hypothetical protein
MATKTEIIPLAETDINELIADADALLKKLEPHLAEGAHLITSLGAVRTVVANLENHIGALKTKAAKAAALAAE